VSSQIFFKQIISMWPPRIHGMCTYLTGVYGNYMVHQLYAPLYKSLGFTTISSSAAMAHAFEVLTG